MATPPPSRYAIRVYSDRTETSVKTWGGKTFTREVEDPIVLEIHLDEIATRYTGERDAAIREHLHKILNVPVDMDTRLDALHYYLHELKALNIITARSI